jgi:hypothetical protein
MAPLEEICLFIVTPMALGDFSARVAKEPLDGIVYTMRHPVFKKSAKPKTPCTFDMMLMDWA